MRDEKLKTVLTWVLEAGIAEEPKCLFTIAHNEYREYVADCPECDKQVRPNRDWTFEGKAVYLPVSFCPICGTPIDWRGALSEDDWENWEVGEG